MLLVVLLAAATYCGFRASRDVWFIAIVATLVLAQWWGPNDGQGHSVGLGYWAVAVAASLLLVFAVPGMRVSDGEIEKWMKKLYPVEACAFIENHHLTPPLYNSYTWGGYLIWRLPQLPVSIDGRANLHRDERIDRSYATIYGKERWSKDEELFQARTILLPRDRPLTMILRIDPRFRKVYEDEVASVFEPVAPPEAGGAAASGQNK